MLRDIHISPVLNGFIVKIGCQTVVFQDRNDMAVEIGRYYGDSDSVEKEYRTKSINRSLLTDLRPPEVPPPHMTAQEAERSHRETIASCQQQMQGLGQGLPQALNQAYTAAANPCPPPVR